MAKIRSDVTRVT